MIHVALLAAAAIDHARESARTKLRRALHGIDSETPVAVLVHAVLPELTVGELLHCAGVGLSTWSRSNCSRDCGIA